MRVQTRFQCEQCKTYYLDRRFAERCEATILPDCPIKVGDNVLVRVRYGEPETDIVQSISIGANFLCSNFIEVEGKLADNYIANFLDKEKDVSMHEYLVHLGREHQIGKDSWSSVVGIDDLTVQQTAT